MPKVKVLFSKLLHLLNRKRLHEVWEKGGQKNKK